MIPENEPCFDITKADWSSALEAPPAGSIIRPFKAGTRAAPDCWELQKIIEEVYSAEAKRLGLKTERYDYSCINTLYPAPGPIWDTHYFIYDPGDGIMRGLLGNLIGEYLKQQEGVDIGPMFETIRFDFQDVLFRLPGVDAPGYGHFHAFLNVLNRALGQFNTVVAYIRQEDSASFRHGFHDHLALIQALPDLDNGQPATAGEIEQYPIFELGTGELYEARGKGVRLLIASLASCNWNLVGFDGYSEEEMLELEDMDIPLKDRLTDSFHHFNGMTPHAFERTVLERWRAIRHFLKDELETGAQQPEQAKHPAPQLSQEEGQSG